MLPRRRSSRQHRVLRRPLLLLHLSPPLPPPPPPPPPLLLLLRPVPSPPRLHQLPLPAARLSSYFSPAFRLLQDRLAPSASTDVFETNQYPLFLNTFVSAEIMMLVQRLHRFIIIIYSVIGMSLIL